jgi:hypothetical protein
VSDRWWEHFEIAITVGPHTASARVITTDANGTTRRHPGAFASSPTEGRTRELVAEAVETAMKLAGVAG